LLHSTINDAAFGPTIQAIDFVIVAISLTLGFFNHNRFAPRALKNMYGKYGAIN